MSTLKPLSRLAAAAGLSLAGAFPAAAALPKDISAELVVGPAECQQSGRYVYKPLNTVVAGRPVFYDCLENRMLTVSCNAVYRAWSQTHMVASMNMNDHVARKDMGQFSLALSACS